MGKDSNVVAQTAHKKKRPKKRPLKAVVEQEETESNAKRNFETDLVTYLSAWKNREDTGTWKFNKAWALENCFDKKKISLETFKTLVPYIKSVQGGARDRLLDKVQLLLEKNIDENNDDDESSKSALKRALKLKTVLDSP